jgi:hypothetical protein
MCVERCKLVLMCALATVHMPMHPRQPFTIFTCMALNILDSIAKVQTVMAGHQCPLLDEAQDQLAVSASSTLPGLP